MSIPLAIKADAIVSPALACRVSFFQKNSTVSVGKTGSMGCWVMRFCDIGLKFILFVYSSENDFSCASSLSIVRFWVFTIAINPVSILPSIIMQVVYFFSYRTQLKKRKSNYLRFPLALTNSNLRQPRVYPCDVGH